MPDTAQSLPGTAETEALPVSREEALSDAASAFKVHLGQEEPAPAPKRAPNGQFAPADGAETGDEGGEEIEAEADPGEGEDEAESRDDGVDGDEAAEEAQHKDPNMPESWPADKAEVWNELPQAAQELIAQRDRDANSAVNAKFMEAANLRKAHEAEIIEARTTRTRAIEAIDIAIAKLAPREPPLSMLNAASPDYDPDGYHLDKAQYEQELADLNALQARQREFRAQDAQEEQQAAAQFYQTIQAATTPALLRDVPDLADPAKGQSVIVGLMEYAIGLGAPQSLFETPTTALEWHTLWKAREFDKLQAAKAKVKTDPVPTPRKAGPAIRPGMTTSASARANARKQQAFDRLGRSGSIQDGAAVFKELLKG